jgi:hypothetical protein
MEQSSYVIAIANQWFWMGVAAGTGAGMFLSALIRWVTESRD